MKKLIIFSFLIPVLASAQTTKTEEIFSGGHCTVSCTETFNNDSLVSAYVTFDAKDDRLPTLQNYFTICYDTPQHVYIFLTELEKFSTDNSKNSIELSGHKVEIDKIAVPKAVKVFDERGLIFHRFQPTLITNVKSKLGEWAIKNKIKLE
ncbi:MAG: hypothetical protein Q8868_07085 [Bacteroidota bacterium]|nr:hypothetical protein [Bacteroidota bacterium]